MNDDDVILVDPNEIINEHDVYQTTLSHKRPLYFYQILCFVFIVFILTVMGVGCMFDEECQLQVPTFTMLMSDPKLSILFVSALNCALLLQLTYTLNLYYMCRQDQPVMSTVAVILSLLFGLSAFVAMLVTAWYGAFITIVMFLTWSIFVVFVLLRRYYL